jgi:predicted PurR-regulated permease PerM
MDPHRVDTQASLWLRDRCVRIVTAAVVLALLYVGRDVLIPLVVAIILSLLVAPLVRALRQVGLGRTPSVLIAVLALSLSCAAVTVVLGTHVVRVAESLPQYRATVERKLEVLNTLTGGRLTLLTSEATGSLELLHPNAGESGNREATERPVRFIRRLLSSAWASVQAVGIVLVVLVFVLLEHESLRDRFIRLVGATDIRLATLALNDAGERLSKFFVSQFAVNSAFGLAIGLSLSVLHVPQAMLFGALAGIMRFVPYIGTVLAAFLSTALAFAVDPGWALAASTLAVFVLLDLIVGQLVEPHLYGHATGLSPLSVVVAAIFWSALWGPVGLILSIPLTLCLVVAGRHIKGLGILELLLSDAQPLTLPQKFYQRALSADPQEIIADARVFLKRNSPAAYCDCVLIPALHLAQLDAEAGAISEDQQLRIARVITHVVATLSSERLKLPRWRYRGSVLDNASAGHWLREQREQASGRWQGPIGVPPGSVVICLGLGSAADDLVAELLARLLLDQKIDARHFSPEELTGGLPPGANPAGVSLVYLVSAFSSPERERAESVRKRSRGTFPYAHVVKVFCAGLAAPAEAEGGAGQADRTASSLVEAMQMCTASPRRPTAHTPAAIPA